MRLEPEPRSVPQVEDDVRKHYRRVPLVIVADALIHRQPLVDVHAAGAVESPGITRVQENDR